MHNRRSLCNPLSLGRVGLGVLEEQEQAEVFTQVKRQRIETTFKERRRSAFDDKKLQGQLTGCINISQQLDEAKNIPLENNTILKEYDAHKVNEDGEEIKIGGWVRSLTIDDVSFGSRYKSTLERTSWYQQLKITYLML